jgi:hypothetical protein
VLAIVGLLVVGILARTGWAMARPGTRAGDSTTVTAQPETGAVR